MEAPQCLSCLSAFQTHPSRSSEARPLGPPEATTRRSGAGGKHWHSLPSIPTAFILGACKKKGEEALPSKSCFLSCPITYEEKS